MSQRPFVSIVIPTFNRVTQVQAALKSVLAQTFREFEVIVVDDGSSDGTGEVIQTILSSLAIERSQIRYLFQTNQGQSAARNRGADQARGEWVAFLDSDDIWLPEKLELQVDAIEQFKGKSCACITDARLIDNLGMDETAFSRGGKHYEETLGIELGAVDTLVYCRDPFWLSTLLVRNNAAKRIGWFDLQLRYAEDHDFLFRLSLVTPFCYVNRPLAVIDRSRSPQGSTCRPWDDVEVRLRGSQLMLEKWLTSESKLPTDMRKTIIHGLRHVYSAWANWYLEHELYEEARQAVCKAIKCEPSTKLAIKWLLTHVAPSFAKRISPRMSVSKMSVY
jgi:glycosyltransferase involved in cell wall biosynthesis